MDEAQQIVNENRDADDYACHLRNELPAETREELVHLLGKLLVADGRSDSFERDPRDRYQVLLGVRVDA